MNVIMILIDSLNRHCLGPYGNTVVRTPNIDRLAERSVVFDNHFIGSAPCMPARRELMTGRKEFLWRGWGPMEPFDRHIAMEAKLAGAVTAIVTDHYHYWEHSAHGYVEQFDAVKMIRGQELDMWNTDPCAQVPDWVSAIDRHRPGHGARYYRNVKDFHREEDFFSPQTMSAAADWLAKNHSHEKFLLWVENFDVHEPFHLPEPYRSMYTDALDERFTCWPPYQSGYFGHDEAFWQSVTAEELAFIRAQYYGKITMVDTWLGKIFAQMDALHLWDNTAIILTTDHGHELGEKQRFGKQAPHYDLSAHIPLMIWHPGLQGAFRSQAFTTAVDVYPTILEMLGGDVGSAPHGRSLLPLLWQETEAHRAAVVYGEFGAGATVTNQHYTYHAPWDAQAELNNYSAMMLSPSPEATGGKFIPGVNCPVWKMPVARQTASLPELLFDRRRDPAQEHDLSRSERATCQEMREILRGLMDEAGVPPEQYVRLGLVP